MFERPKGAILEFNGYPNYPMVYGFWNGKSIKKDTSITSSNPRNHVDKNTCIKLNIRRIIKLGGISAKDQKAPSWNSSSTKPLKLKMIII